jgi:hypothetical protein
MASAGADGADADSWSGAGLGLLLSVLVVLCQLLSALRPCLKLPLLLLLLAGLTEVADGVSSKEGALLLLVASVPGRPRLGNSW